MIRFIDPIYERTYYFISQDLEKLQKKVLGEVMTFGQASGWYISKKHISIIYVKGFKKTNEHLATLAHEINHAVDYIAEEYGIEDTEAKSYYASFLTREILNRYKRIQSRR